jgi:hypothetical protein
VYLITMVVASTTLVLISIKIISGHYQAAFEVLMDFFVVKMPYGFESIPMLLYTLFKISYMITIIYHGILQNDSFFFFYYYHTNLLPQVKRGNSNIGSLPKRDQIIRDETKNYSLRGSKNE